MKEKLLAKATKWLEKKGISGADVALLISTITLIIILLKG